MSLTPICAGQSRKTTGAGMLERLITNRDEAHLDKGFKSGI